MSLQYLKKEGRDEVDFLHAYKHETILQVFIIAGHSEAYPDYPPKNKFAKSLQHLKTEVRMKLIFVQ